MKDLMVVVYDNPDSALDTLDKLRSLNSEWLVGIHDAVAVVRGYDGQLHMQDSYQMTPEEGGGWGVWWGGLLGGLALAPFTGGLSAAVATATVVAGVVGGATLGGATGAMGAEVHKEDTGLPQYFVDEVSAALQPGASTIFVVAESPDPLRVAEFFRATGGTILRTTLPQWQQERIQAILTDHH
jgi:uncharacterized membrane protein